MQPCQHRSVKVCQPLCSALPVSSLPHGLCAWRTLPLLHTGRLNQDIPVAVLGLYTECVSCAAAQHAAMPSLLPRLQTCCHQLLQGGSLDAAFQQKPPSTHGTIQPDQK